MLDCGIIWRHICKVQRTRRRIRVLTGDVCDAYAVRMDILAFGSARGARDRVGVRRHSVRYEVRAVGRGGRLHHPRDRMQGQNGLKV
jgi:hypothetical protein